MLKFSGKSVYKGIAMGGVVVLKKNRRSRCGDGTCKNCLRAGKGTAWQAL